MELGLPPSTKCELASGGPACWRWARFHGDLEAEQHTAHPAHHGTGKLPAPVLGLLAGPLESFGHRRSLGTPARWLRSPPYGPESLAVSDRLVAWPEPLGSPQLGGLHWTRPIHLLLDRSVQQASVELQDYLVLSLPLCFP